MSQSSFFIRIRGKVSGPHSAEGLQRMVRMGSLSRVHEISADRANWVRAAEYEELFPSPPAPAAASPAASTMNPPAARVAPAPAPVTAETPHGSSTDRFYYSHNGQSIGPVSMSILTLLARNGTLGGDDNVWRENAESAVPARQVPALKALFPDPLAAMFPTNPPPAWGPPPAPTPPVNVPRRRALQYALRSAESTAAVGGIVGGALLLVCLLLPWFSKSDRSFWFWDLYNSAGDGMWAAVTTFLLLCGTTLCIIAFTTRGIARAVCYISLAGFAILLIAAAMLQGHASPGDSLLWLFVPVGLGGMVGVCSARGVLPQMLSARILLGIFSGIVAGGILTGAILSLSRDTSLSDAPADVVVGLVLIVAGALVALAAAITGFVGLKPAYTPGLSLATRILAILGVGLPMVGLLVLVIAMIRLVPYRFVESGVDALSIQNLRLQVAQAVFRILVVWSVLLEVMAVGIHELLLAAGAQSASSGA